MSPPVILGSSLSGLLVSLSLSRAGIEHIVVGDDTPPPAIPRLGESIIDTSSPELWRLYGEELAHCFHKKSHISYLNGHFSTMIHLASPVRSDARCRKFARPQARYAWFGEALFHLDRIAFDLAIFHKARAQSQCRFVAARSSRIVLDGDAVTRIELSDGSAIEQPRYVFDAVGWKSPIAEAAKVAVQPLSIPQRVVWTHYRRENGETMPPEWWRHGTNLLRLDREYDGIDAMAWMIPLGATLSVGLSVDQAHERANDDPQSLMHRLDEAFRRRGIDYRATYPDQAPIQELRHSYFIRERGAGKNWLLCAGSFVSIWFPSSTGLWTACAAAGMAPDLIEHPELGRFYERAMRQLTRFHKLLDRVAHGPVWKSTLQVYNFFGTGGAYIWGRVAYYLRIKHRDYGPFKPSAWALQALGTVGRLFPPFMCLFFVFALVRSRLDVERTRQGRPFALYFRSIRFRLWNALRSIPHLLWGAIPRAGRGLPASTSARELPEPAARRTPG